MRILLVLLALPLTAVAVTPAGTGARIKELATLEGVRDNQLVGYGLVVGLNGTGDRRQTYFSAQTLTNMLERMGVQVPPTAIAVRNTAAVLITANLPPFSQPGARIDVTAAAIGDSTNLQGGLLILTPLKAPDGSVFAVAQGAVITGGFVAGRSAGNSTTVNHPTVGRIPSGAIVERAAPSVQPGGKIKFQLRQTDFTTAARMAAAINSHFEQEEKPLAKAENSGLVTVDVPTAFQSRRVEFIAEIETLRVESDRPVKVVINERTGTIVLGKEVRIKPVAILHGALTVEVRTTFDVSQPAPLANGATAVVPQVNVGSNEERAKNVSLKDGATIEDLVKALTAIGSTPRDVIAVLQNLRACGALEADLEVI
jgi:flagellar P-ring protein precursor FlgI